MLPSSGALRLQQPVFPCTAGRDGRQTKQRGREERTTLSGLLEGRKEGGSRECVAHHQQ